MTITQSQNRITSISISKFLLLFIFIFSVVNINAQTGLNFQGVARNSNNVILASQQISLRLSVLQGSATGTAEYTETRTVTTNAQGLFTAVIGDAGATSTLGNFNTINWKNTPKYLKIEMDAAAGTNFTTMGTTQFQYVAYAQFANGVDAANIAGIVPVEKGGTGVASITALKTALAIDKTTVGLSNVDNTADLLKPITTATQTALNLKANTLDVTTSLALKLNKTDTSNLLQKADTITLSNRIDLKVGKVAGKELSTNDYTTAEKTKLAAIAGTNTGDQDLTSYATNTALALKANTSDINTSLGLKASVTDVTTSLALKEDATNKSAAADLGGLSPSDILYPTQKAVKDFVAANSASGGVADGGITTIKLADGAVTDAKLGSGISKSKMGLGNVENTALSTWSGNTNISSLGIIETGTWSGTTIGYSKLNLTNKIVNNDIVDNTITLQKLGISKTDFTNFGLAGDEEVVIYQAGSGLISSTIVNPGAKRSGSDGITTTFSIDGINTSMILDGAIANSKIGDGEITGAKILNGEITDSKLSNGLSKSKVGLGNVENTALSTWSGSNNLTTTGIISSGIWSGTTISLEKGGTGAANAGDARVNLGLVIGTNVQAPLVAGTDYLAPIGSAASLTNFPILNQNTTGNASTATIAGNITATSNSTLTDLQNLSGVGTITTGVWSGTTISVSNGGTGSASLTSNNILLGNGLNALQTVAPGTSGNVLVSNGSTWVSEPMSPISAGNLTGTTLASNVVNSSLTSLGVLSNTTVNGKLIVGSSTAVSSSAVLEASSTSQGFLPPRLSYYQRTQIASPVAGLTIWCSNCGNSGEMQVFDGGAWTNMSGGTATSTLNLTIGQSYQGGKIAYILVLGDPGYDENTSHGLIAALTDQGSVIKWNDYPNSDNWPETRATGLAIGTGLSNTNIIIESQNALSVNYAAKIARAHLGGGYTDWYLPSQDELNKLYLNKSAIGISGYVSSVSIAYWSSSESGKIFSWFQNFASGGQTAWYKSSDYYVRAVRSF